MATLTVFVATVTLVKTSAIANSTSSDDSEPPFVPQPQGRGTVGLLFSCVITLILCVWTAIHLNIIKDPTPRRILRTRITYVLLGLFAPEIVLAISYREWMEATQLLEERPVMRAEAEAEQSNKLLGGFYNLGRVNISRPGRPDAARGQPHLKGHPGDPTVQLQEGEQPWKVLIGKPDANEIRTTTNCGFGMECSFFAVMGGYTYSPFSASDTPREFTLTTDGLAFLLDQGLILGDNIARLKGQIMDKGKADLLAKFLTCGQALWMMMNCLSRKIVHLPITLIEINVVVHVFCALSMYVFWLRKPHNAGQSISLSPTILDHEISCILYVQVTYGDHFSVTEELFNPNITNEPSPRVSKTLNNISPTAGTRGSSLEILKDPHWRGSKIYVSVTTSNKPDGSVTLLRGQILEDRRNGFRLTTKMPLYLTKTELDILAQAAHGLRDPKFLSLVRFFPETRYIARHPSFTCINREPPTIKEIFWAIVPLSLAYGGVHATAWNSHFPSLIERDLWRISCMMVGIPALAVCVVVVCGTVGVWLWFYLMPRVGFFHERSRKGGGPLVNVFLYDALGMVCDPVFSYMEYAMSDPFACYSSISMEQTMPRYSFPWIGITITLLGLIGGIIGTETHPSPTAVRRTLEVFLACSICFLMMLLHRIYCRDSGGRQHSSWSVISDRWDPTPSGTRWYFRLRLPVRYSIFALCTLQAGLLWLLMISYVGARVFVIVESFISVRRLPTGAFKTVPWQDFWPHF